MGTYISYVKTLWEIIDDIADQLIATADWEEGDATWDTTTKTERNARRVVHHIADDIYLSLIMENGEARSSYSTTYYWWKGLILCFSSGWDAVNHQPDGSKYYTFAPFEVRGTGSTSKVLADLATMEVAYYLFTLDSGFALVVTPPPTTDNYQRSAIVVVERNTNKLYADGFTNFYIFVEGSGWHAYHNTYAAYPTIFGDSFKWWTYTRPFTLQSQAGYENPYSRGALLSHADDKAYFAKPLFHNDAAKTSPIFQGELFLFVIKELGLFDDDEIAMPGPSTKKYHITLKQSPDSTGYMEYAIMKAE